MTLGLPNTPAPDMHQKHLLSSLNIRTDCVLAVEVTAGRRQESVSGKAD